MTTQLAQLAGADAVGIKSDSGRGAVRALDGNMGGAAGNRKQAALTC